MPHLNTDIPNILETDRLILHFADPNNEEDCKRIISVYQDAASSLGGNARVAVNSIEDVHTKHKVFGPKQHLCTKAKAPNKIYHLVYHKDAPEELLGFIGMNFRPEMPYPDIGYGFFRPHWGKGYASEAGKRSLRFWREVIGVKEVCCCTLENNQRSQRVAEKIGFVKCGTLDIVFGKDGDHEKIVTATAYVLPEMEWRETDAEGKRWCIRPTVGTETEAQKNDGLKVG